MPRLPSRPAALRGLLVAIDGLAIWFLAVVIASYSTTTAVSTDAGGLTMAIVDIMRSWMQTPTMEVLELTAYAGLALVAFGPVWYWVIKPIKQLLGRSSAQTSVSDERFTFDEDPTASTTDLVFVNSDPVAADSQQMTLDGTLHPSSDWSSRLFDGGKTQPRLHSPTRIPGGDFLRGSGSPDGVSDDESEDDFSLEDILVEARYQTSDGKPDGSEEVKASISRRDSVASNGGTREQDVADAASSGDTVASPSEFQQDASGGEGSTAPDGDVNGGTSGELSHDEASDSNAPTAQPDDPIEMLTEVVETSRGRIETITEKISQPSEDSSAAVAEEALADIRHNTDDTRRSIQQRVPDAERSFAVDIEAMRADQERLETTLVTELSD